MRRYRNISAGLIAPREGGPSAYGDIKVNKSNRTDRNRDKIRDRDIIKGWQARLFRRGDANGPAFIDYTFPTEDGRKGRLQVPRSEIRHRRRLLDRFCDLMALFPARAADDNARVAFLEKLASRDHRKVEVFPTRPGFVSKDCFAMWDVLIHGNGGRTPVPPTDGKAGFSDTKGSLAGSDENVLRLARHSTYLAFAIGVAFAAPLPSYLRLRGNPNNRELPVLTETAVFNFSGKSSSGKSSAALAAMSLVGSLDRAGMVNFSERGLVEYAADHNDLLTVLDDTESRHQRPSW